MSWHILFKDSGDHAVILTEILWKSPKLQFHVLFFFFLFCEGERLKDNLQKLLPLRKPISILHREAKTTLLKIYQETIDNFTKKIVRN